MFRTAPERLADSISADGLLSGWSLDRASVLLQDADDAQFERIMSAVEASPETRACRWLEYGEKEWSKGMYVQQDLHREILSRIGFEAHGSTAGPLAYSDAAAYELTMGAGYERPESIVSTAMGMPLRKKRMWLEAAALQGDPSAQYELANVLAWMNEGCTAQSMRWILCSAASGHAEACSAIAFCALARTDLLDLAEVAVPQEDAMRLLWYAASKKDPAAVSNLSTISEGSGLDVPHAPWTSAPAVAAPSPGLMSQKDAERLCGKLVAPKAVRNRTRRMGLGQDPLYRRSKKMNDTRRIVLDFSLGRNEYNRRFKGSSPGRPPSVGSEMYRTAFSVSMTLACIYPQMAGSTSPKYAREFEERSRAVRGWTVYAVRKHHRIPSGSTQDVRNEVIAAVVANTLSTFFEEGRFREYDARMSPDLLGNMLKEPESRGRSDLAGQMMGFPELFRTVRSDAEATGEGDGGSMFLPVEVQGEAVCGFARFCAMHPYEMSDRVRAEALSLPDSCVRDERLEDATLSLVGMCGTIDHREGVSRLEAPGTSKPHPDLPVKSVIAFGHLLSISE